MTPARKKTTKKKPTRKKAPVKKKPTRKKASVKKSPKKKMPTKKSAAKKAAAKKPTLKKKAAAKAGAKKQTEKKAAPKKSTPVQKAESGKKASSKNGDEKKSVKNAPKVRSRQTTTTKEPAKRPDLPRPTPVERSVTMGGGLGEKHVCFSCSAKFYDLGRPEPICPKCGADQRDAPRTPKARAVPPSRTSDPPEPLEEKPKRKRLLDEDEEEIDVLDSDGIDDALELGLGVVDDEDDDEEDEEEEVL